MRFRERVSRDSQSPHARPEYPVCFCEYTKKAMKQGCWVPVLIVLFGLPVRACMCAEHQPLCQDYWAASTVFSGTVTEMFAIPYSFVDRCRGSVARASPHPYQCREDLPGYNRRKRRVCRLGYSRQRAGCAARCRES